MGRKRSNKTKINSWDNLSAELESCKHPENLPKPIIYIIPEDMRRSNARAYKPREVSIGPVHRGSSWKLAAMEKTKIAYSKALLDRIEKNTGVKKTIEDFRNQMIADERKIRDSYEHVLKKRHDFLQNILIDCLFIVEILIRIYFEFDTWKYVDPLIRSRGESFMFIDLILLENQVAYFLLDGIFNSVGMRNKDAKFIDLACHYFKRKNPQMIKPAVPPCHFTDLMRQFMLPKSTEELYQLASERTEDYVEKVYSITQLWEAGMRFEVSSNDCPISIAFHKGTLILPRIEFYSSTELVLRNILAFEQNHCLSSPFITEYVYLLHLLIQSESDAQILINKEIIVNRGGSVGQLPKLLDKLCRHNVLMSMNLGYDSVCRSLNAYYDNWWNITKATTWRICCKTPWKLISCLAGGNVLGLEWTQAIIAFKSYNRNR